MKSLLAFIFLLAAAADPVSESRKLQTEAMQAFRAKDAAVFLEKIRGAAALRPKHPTIHYQLAVAQTMNGMRDEAVATLERVAAMGFIYTPQKQAEFSVLADSPRYQEVLRRFEANAKPHGAPASAFTIDETGLIAEGMAYDRATGRFFVSSVHAKKIFAIKDGKASAFASGFEWGVFGLAVDSKRGVLWAASSALPQVEGFRDEDRDKAALLKIDLRSGKLLATLRPDDKEKHLFGDVTVSPSGEVFVSDGGSPVIHRVENDTLVPFVRGPFTSLQGIAASPRYLYVSDYAGGLYAIDPSTRDAVLLTTPDDVSLLGVDGIYLTNDRTLIAVQNGANPMRVLRVELTPGGLGVAKVTTLAANHESMSDVTLGVLARGAFHFIANAQWDAWDDKGERNTKVTLEPARVLRVKP